MEQAVEFTNVHDDELMVRLGIRQPPFLGVEHVSKTKDEKRQLGKLRCRHKGKMHFSIPKKRNIPVVDNLIVWLKKNNIFKDTTYSKKCYQHEIPQILSFFHVLSKKGNDQNFILKYYYNGKMYKPNELPFYFS